jgi:cytochrome c oxidase subunit II
MMRRTLVAIGVLAVVLLIPAGAYAGGDGHGGGMDEHRGGGMGQHRGRGHQGGDAPTTPGAREIDVTAKSFEFTPDEITIQTGEDVTIVMKSTDIFHDFVVKGEGHIVGAKAKKTKQGGLRIDEPGTYRFWCSVPGHRSAGMKGTIVVQ